MLLSRYSDHVFEVGCDEVGRGCIAGPVFAAAVILPKDFYHPQLNDSKKISEKNRYLLRDIIMKESLFYSVSYCDVQEIDEMNILNASIMAMNKAILGLGIKPDFLIIDGNYFKFMDNSLICDYACVVGGDSKYASIAAASILAKTFRDEYMRDMHNKYPHYNWVKNKGYPTKEHRNLIRRYGVTPLHRKTFKLF